MTIVASTEGALLVSRVLGSVIGVNYVERGQCSEKI
jgi:hypothetical protein